jgi:fructokinase
MSAKVLCIGEILWDMLPRGPYLGGAPFNVACHLNRLGVEAIFASRVGHDAPGENAILKMKQMGISTKSIQHDQRHPTGVVNVAFDSDENPIYDIVQDVAWDYLQLTEPLKLAAKESDAVIFGSLAQRHAQSRQTIRQILDVVPLRIFDVNLRPPFDSREIVEASLMKAEIVKLNEEELMTLAGWFDLPSDLNKASIGLCDRFDCETICVTRGQHGSALWHEQNWMEYPGFKIQVKDAIGAGDAFLAALIYGLLSGKDHKEMLEYANAVGAYVAGCSGATPQLDIEKINLLLKEVKK